MTLIRVSADAKMSIAKRASGLRWGGSLGVYGVGSIIWALGDSLNLRTDGYLGITSRDFVYIYIQQAPRMCISQLS